MAAKKKQGARAGDVAAAVKVAREAVKAAKAALATHDLARLTAEERVFPFRGGHRFRDPETEAELIGDGVAARADLLARFTAAREALQAARFNGVLTVKAGDKWVTYKSDAELQSALHDLDREIAQQEGRPPARRIRTYAGKGL